MMERRKTTQTIGIHNCDMSDFYNNINLLRSLDKNKLSDLKCLDDLNKVIKIVIKIKMIILRIFKLMSKLKMIKIFLKLKIIY